jgi:hypothetical protein
VPLAICLLCWPQRRDMFFNSRRRVSMGAGVAAQSGIDPTAVCGRSAEPCAVATGAMRQSRPVSKSESFPLGIVSLMYRSLLTIIYSLVANDITLALFARRH